MACKTLCELEPKAETQKNQGAVVLALSSSTECRGWGSIQQLGKGGIEVIADMDLDPDSLSQVEEAFISAGLL